MTGFGRGAASGDGFALAVEIKTVNNRFLDIHLRLGQELSAIELDIRKRVSARLSRGRVDININFDRTGETKYELNQGIIAGYVDALRDIQRQFNLTGDIDVNAVARLPGALTTAREGLNDTERTAIYDALDQALNDLETMRASEGAALTDEMLGRVGAEACEVWLGPVQIRGKSIGPNSGVRRHAAVSGVTRAGDFVGTRGATIEPSLKLA